MLFFFFLRNPALSRVLLQSLVDKIFQDDLGGKCARLGAAKMETGCEHFQQLACAPVRPYTCSFAIQLLFSSRYIVPPPPDSPLGGENETYKTTVAAAAAAVEKKHACEARAKRRSRVGGGCAKIHMPQP